MAVLELLSQMKSKGMSTAQMIQSLKEQGFSPKEINEALSQSEIKSELAKQQEFMQQPPQSVNDQMSEFSQSQFSELQPSIESQPTPEDQQQQYPEYQENTSQSQYPEYQTTQSIDFETISDITTQIIGEKLKIIKKEILLITRFRKNAEEKLKHLEQRLDKTETMLNELQIAIIRKVGEYGENIKNISKELQATQQSFSKIIDPLTDNMRELEKISENKTETDKTTDNKKQKSKSKDTFENYIR